MLQVRVVHSKLACGRWPRLETDAHLPARVKATIASWGFESNRPNVSSVDASLGGKGKSMGGWRSKIPLVVARSAWLWRSARSGTPEERSTTRDCGRHPVSVSCRSFTRKEVARFPHGLFHTHTSMCVAFTFPFIISQEGSPFRYNIARGFASKRQPTEGRSS